MCSCIDRGNVFFILNMSSPGLGNAIIVRLRADIGLNNIVDHFVLMDHEFAHIYGYAASGICGLPLLNTGMFMRTGWLLFSMRVPRLFILEAISAAASPAAM